jgi:hypothetical protein
MEFGKLLLSENVVIKKEFVEIPSSTSSSVVDQWWNAMGATCDSLMDPVTLKIILTKLKTKVADPSLWIGDIPKTVSEITVGGIFATSEKLDLKKRLNQSSWRGKEDLLLDLLHLKTQVVPNPLDSGYHYYRLFFASIWRKIYRFLRLSLRTCRSSGLTKKIHQSFDLPLPIYLGSLIDVFQRDIGQKQASDREGHTTIVFKHTIESESSLYGLGFGKNWSTIGLNAAFGAQFCFYDLEGFKEAFPTEKYKEAPSLRPQLFTMKYEIQTETLWITADIKPTRRILQK